jgi:glutamine amidotransferase
MGQVVHVASPHVPVIRLIIFCDSMITDPITDASPRYISSLTSEASSLFVSSGTSFDEYEEGGLYRMTKADKRENIIMIASEPLTFERSDWMEVKTNTMVVITPKVGISHSP